MKPCANSLMDSMERISEMSVDHTAWRSVCAVSAAPPLTLSFCVFAPPRVQVCTEAGMFAIRVERAYVIEEDFMKAVRKIAEVKKLEGKLEYGQGTQNKYTRHTGIERTHEASKIAHRGCCCLAVGLFAYTEKV